MRGLAANEQPVTSPTTRFQLKGIQTENTEMTKKQNEVTASPITRTSAGLRDAIFDEIDAIRNGSSNPTRANAVAKLATGIVETVRMELEVQRHLRNVTPSNVEPAGNSILGSPLALGA